MLHIIFCCELDVNLVEIYTASDFLKGLVGFCGRHWWLFQSFWCILMINDRFISKIFCVRYNRKMLCEIKNSNPATSFFPSQNIPKKCFLYRIHLEAISVCWLKNKLLFKEMRVMATICLKISMPLFGPSIFNTINSSILHNISGNFSNYTSFIHLWKCMKSFNIFFLIAAQFVNISILVLIYARCVTSSPKNHAYEAVRVTTLSKLVQLLTRDYLLYCYLKLNIQMRHIIILFLVDRNTEKYGEKHEKLTENLGFRVFFFKYFFYNFII